MNPIITDVSTSAIPFRRYADALDENDQMKAQRIRHAKRGSLILQRQNIIMKELAFIQSPVDMNTDETQIEAIRPLKQKPAPIQRRKTLATLPPLEKNAETFPTFGKRRSLEPTFFDVDVERIRSPDKSPNSPGNAQSPVGTNLEIRRELEVRKEEEIQKLFVSQFKTKQVKDKR